MSKMKFDMLISLRSQNGSVESWQSPPQLACVTEEGEAMAGDTGVVTRLLRDTQLTRARAWDPRFVPCSISSS